MPLGTPIPEKQSAPAQKPIVALRSKLRRFNERLLSAKKHSDLPLPDLPWQVADLKDVSELVHSVYMASHKNEGTTAGKELLWVDREHKSLRLLKTITHMIRAVPLRPVAVIHKELVKIDPSYNPAHINLRRDEKAIARHQSLKESNQRYRELVKLSAALGEPKNSITCVPVNEFNEVLRELCPDVICQLEKGFELHKGARIERLISLTLFLELQRREMVWRLAYWDQVNAIAGWIHELHCDELTGHLSDVAVFVHETQGEYIARRNRNGIKKRVALHRSKQSSA